MNVRTPVILGAALAAFCASAPGDAVAQEAAPLSLIWRPHMVTLTVLGGGAAYSDFITVDMAAGADERLTARTSVAVGAALDYWPSAAWGVRLHAGWSPTRFERERARSSAADLLTDARGADLAVWVADLDLLVRIPLGIARVGPYALIGGGVVRYATDEEAALPAEAQADFTGGTRDRAALVVGAGVRVPLQREGLLLTFELTDHVVRSPVEGPEGDGNGVTSNVRLLVGLTLPLWSARSP